MPPPERGRGPPVFLISLVPVSRPALKDSINRRFQICILAGGLSRRMGRDKSRLRLGDRTLLQHIRAEAKRTGLPVRIIRKDLVPHCGPLGGIYTALKRSRAQATLFLSCDMPFLRAETLNWTFDQFEKLCAARKLREDSSSTAALCLSLNRKASFPFILPKAALLLVQNHLKSRLFSLQNLAKSLDAKIIPPPFSCRPQFRNINTRKDFFQAEKLWTKLNRVF